MKLTRLICVLPYLFANHVHAEPPSENVVTACLQGETIGQAKWIEISTNEVNLDDNFLEGYKATLFKVNGRHIGYAEKGRQAALVWDTSIIPLKNALVLGKPSKLPTEFSPLLADWSLMKQGSQRFMCVNFNFDGLGRSGSFQKVHGLYLLSIPKSKNIKPPLFYIVRPIPAR